VWAQGQVVVHHNLPAHPDSAFLIPKDQGFGSGSVIDPDSIRSVDPDPDLYSECGSVFGIQIRIQEGKNDPQK
jgi:hypothetical protein